MTDCGTFHGPLSPVASGLTLPLLVMVNVVLAVAVVPLLSLWSS